MSTRSLSRRSALMGGGALLLSTAMPAVAQNTKVQIGVPRCGRSCSRRKAFRPSSPSIAAAPRSSKASRRALPT
jgi:hypothetical protein